MPSLALEGVFRSLRMYHGPHVARGPMDLLYERFIKSRDIAFDVGAHVGDRVSSFRRLGARVVAVEPQPLLFRTLKLIHGRDRDVHLVHAAAASSEGAAVMYVNTANPTVSTLSSDFIANACSSLGWEGQNWDGRRTVLTVTLDGLIARFGVPAFVKVDVEGAEASVLDGLTTAVAGLSFEFTTIASDVSRCCIARLEFLAAYDYNLALGETQRLQFEEWVDADVLLSYLDQLPHEANSGDVYARRRTLTA